MLRLILGRISILFINILITILIKIMKNKLIVNLKVNLGHIINSSPMHQLQQNTQVFSLKRILEFIVIWTIKLKVQKLDIYFKTIIS